MIPLALTALLADAFGALQLLFVIVVFVIAAVGKLISWLQALSAAESQKARQRAQSTPRRTPLDDQIGEFLRKASQRRAGGPPAARPPQPASRQPPRARREEPVEVTPIEESPQRFKPLESGLATQAQADAAMEGHLRQVFDHGLGQLSSAGQSPAPVASPTATSGEQSVADALALGPSGLAGLLASGVVMRQAIVLNEIIQRPLDRWR
jgi:type IV secretory pathway VirB10-like protein